VDAKQNLSMGQADGFASALFEHDLDCLPIAPILAGARARGVADALEIVGIAAILIGAEGDVLYANDRARALLVPHLRIVGERLEAVDRKQHDALAGLIEAAIAGDKAEAHSLILRRADGVPGLRLHATPIADGDPYQLLRAVIILDRQS
jgi:PAS domain-containing protein